MPRFAAALLVLIGLIAQPLHAADISIALSADVTSLDPHFHNLTPNNNVANHIFESLVTKE